MASTKVVPVYSTANLTWPFHTDRHQQGGLENTPSASQPAPPITGAAPCDELQEPSSCLNHVLYAFDNALPDTLATGPGARWTANGAQGSTAWIPYTLGGLKLASWILVVLLLAGVTGLLRKT